MIFKFKTNFVFIFLVLLCETAYSQILNVEKSRLQEDSLKKVVGNVGINFSLNNRSATPENKVVFVGFSGNTNVGYYSTKHAYYFISTVNYISITGAPAISTGFAHLRTNLLRKRKLSYELFYQVQYDESRGLNYRSLFGGGVRRNIFKTDKTEAYIGSGIMLETEEWSMPGEGEDSIVVKNIPKSSNYFSIRSRLNPYVDVNFINYYQVGFDNEQRVFRHRLSIDANFVIYISKHLSFTNTFNGGYENRPVVPISKFVYSFSNGFLIKF